MHDRTDNLQFIHQIKFSEHEKQNAVRIQTTGQNVPLSDSQRRGREETKRKTVKDQEVSLTQIMHTPFPPQKGNLLGHTDPFSWPCLGEDSAEEQPGHSTHES